MSSKTRTTAPLFTVPPFEVPKAIVESGIEPISEFSMTQNAWDEWSRLAHVAIDFGDPDQALNLLEMLTGDPKRHEDAVVLAVLGHEHKHGVVESQSRKQFLGKLGLRGFTYDYYEKTKLQVVGRDKTAPLMRATRRVITLNRGSHALYSRTFQDVGNNGYPFAEVFWYNKKGLDHNTSRSQIEQTSSPDGTRFVGPADPLNVQSKIRMTDDLMDRAVELAIRGAAHNDMLTDETHKIWYVTGESN